MMDELLGYLDQVQHDFPVMPKPFAALAERWQLSEADVLALFAEAKQRGVLGRIGAVFTPHAMGVSTLAAMQVPAAEIDRIAAIVSGCPGVNHNYLRDHAINLWFVMVADNAAMLEERLTALQNHTGLPVLDLRLEEEFHIDLGFSLTAARQKARKSSALHAPNLQHASLDKKTRHLVSTLGEGLPLVSSPYHELSIRLECDEEAMLEQINAWQHCGVIRRFGAVLNHRALGFTANAMCVWNVPDDKVSALGARVAEQPAVTLCYRRRRCLPRWPYNLFVMIHGRDAEVVRRQAGEIATRCGLASFDSDILFSTRCFKQRGARYFNTDTAP